MHDLWADLRGHPAPHSGERCGAPTRSGAPCRIDAATCGWHGPRPVRPTLRVAASGYSDRPYTSRRLRHLNVEPDNCGGGGPDGDGGEPMPVMAAGMCR